MDAKRIEVGQRWRQKWAPEFVVKLIKVTCARVRYLHEASGSKQWISVTDLWNYWEPCDAEG